MLSGIFKTTFFPWAFTSKPFVIRAALPVVSKDNLKYFMIVNCDHTQARSTNITMNGKIKTVQKLSKQNGEWEKITLKNSKNNTFLLDISEGNGEVF